MILHSFSRYLLSAINMLYIINYRTVKRPTCKINMNIVHRHARNQRSSWGTISLRYTLQCVKYI